MDSSMNKPSINPARCPLCGGPNLCATAADPEAPDCWCGSLKFPEELLDLVPKDAVRRACICQACLEQYQETGEIPGRSK